MTRLDFFDESLDAWRDARQRLIREVDKIPANEFDFRPTPAVQSAAITDPNSFDTPVGPAHLIRQ